MDFFSGRKPRFASSLEARYHFSPLHGKQHSSRSGIATVSAFDQPGSQRDKGLSLSVYYAHFLPHTRTIYTLEADSIAG